MSEYRKALAMEAAYHQVANVLNRKDLLESERAAIRSAAVIIARAAYEAGCRQFGKERLDETMLALKESAT